MIQYRQGDVLLNRRIKAIPREAQELAPDGNKVILKLGEATGHHHFFTASAGRIFVAPNGERHFRSFGETPAGKVEGIVIEVADTSIRLRPRGSEYPINFSKAHALLSDTGVETTADWSLLSHQEHDGEAVPVGDYDLPNQREYSPEAIRNVAD